MVDDFLSKPTTRPHEYLSSHKQYQLLSIAALYTVIKVHESVAFGSDVFAALSNGLYSQQEIEDMEMVLLTGLQWRIFRTPTSIQMAEQFLAILMSHVDMDESSWNIVRDEVRFQCECAVRDYHLSTMQRGVSAVALAAVLNTFERIGSRVPQGDIADLLFDVDESFASRRDEVLASMERLKYLVRQVEQVGPSSMPHVILPMEEEIENE